MDFCFLAFQLIAPLKRVTRYPLSRFVPDTWPATSSHQQPPPIHVHILHRYHLALLSSLCNNTNTFSFILGPLQYAKNARIYTERYATLDQDISDERLLCKVMEESVEIMTSSLTIV